MAVFCAYLFWFLLLYSVLSYSNIFPLCCNINCFFIFITDLDYVDGSCGLEQEGRVGCWTGIETHQGKVKVNIVEITFWLAQITNYSEMRSVQLQLNNVFILFLSVSTFQQNYTALLGTFCQTPKSEMTLMLRIQDFCYDNMNFMKVFHKIILLLYKSKRIILFCIIIRLCKLF